MSGEPSPAARQPSGVRAWAATSLAAGALWVIFAVAPVPLTSLLGLPFAAYAILVGAFCLRRSLRAGDRGSARRAGLGLGLGCAGLVYLLAFYAIAGSLLAAAALSLLRSVMQSTGSP